MSDESSKIGRISLWIFAAVGAIASALSISDLISQPEPELRGEVYVNKYVLPDSLKNAFSVSGSDNLYDFAVKLSIAFECPTSSAEKAEKIEEKEGEQVFHDCGHFEEIKRITEDVESQNYLDVAFLDIKLHNEGRRVAQGLRLKAEDFLELNVTASGEKAIEVERDKAGFYILPDLNPGDELQIEILKRGVSFNYKPFNANDMAPKVTYRDGSAYFEVFVHDYANQFDRLSKNSPVDWFFLIVIGVFISFIVVLFVILMASVAVGIYRGAPMREWLNSFDDRRTGEPDPSPPGEP